MQSTAFGGLHFVGVIFDIIRAGAKAIHGLDIISVISPAFDSVGQVGIDYNGICFDIMFRLIFAAGLESCIRDLRLSSIGSGNNSRRRDYDKGDNDKNNGHDNTTSAALYLDYCCNATRD